MKFSWLPAGLLYTLLSTSLLVSCGKGDDSGYNSGGNGNSNPPPAANTVTMYNMAFSPGNLKVKTGTTITWSNDDNMSHTVTSDNGTFNSGTLKTGETFKYTFNTVGSFPYHCNFHSGMKGTVVVE